MSFDKRLKDKFWEEGFLIFETGFRDICFDQITQSLDYFWTKKEAPKGILNHKIQEENLKNGSNRLQDLWEVFPVIREIAIHHDILALLQFLYNDRPKPFQTLNFPVGTQQTVHSDALHFNSKPFGKMCGVWIALEDIEPKSGPLFYYPKSHLLPELSEELLGFMPVSDNYSKVIEYWEKQIDIHKYDRIQALLKKGQAIIWHGNLLHGGMPRKDSFTTRHSQVTHYYFGDAKPWRQLTSLNEIQYFEPNWIPISNL